MQMLGYLAIALLSVQIYYIILHYEDIVRYVETYSNFRYGIDIVPQYIDPTTSDINDTIAADVRTKRRCVLQASQYVIASLNGYAVNTDNTLKTYGTLINCVIDMTENYPTFPLSNPCLSNPISPSCLALLALL